MRIRTLSGTRIYGLGRTPFHSYPSYAPKVILHRSRHFLFGPLLGCSCSGPGKDEHGRPLGWRPLLARGEGGCFRSRWRIAYSNEVTSDRVRVARLEEAVRKAGIDVPR